MKWIISANNKVYNHFKAFKDRGVIDWRMNNTKFEVNDIIYIYSSRPLMQLSFKCLVVETDIDKKTMINDDEYWIDKEHQSLSNTYMRLVLLETFNDSRLKLNELTKWGLRSAPQGPVKLSNKPQLENYIKGIEGSHTTIQGFNSFDSAISKNTRVVSRISEVITRVGQNIFREKLLKKYDEKCCLCGVEGKDFLIASHIREWSECDEGEHLDDKNGLLLCPNHDKLFDKHFISFTNQGKIIIGSRLSKNNAMLLNIQDDMKIKVSEEQLGYLEYHRSKLK